MLDSLFNSVHFSLNLCFLNILLYTDQILYHDNLDFYTRFLNKME